MKTHNIPLDSIVPKKPLKVKFEKGELHIPVDESKLGKSRHHVNVPDKYKLPFRIDMTVKAKFVRTNQIASQLSLYIGDGRLYFNGGHTSCTEILAPSKSSVFGDNELASMVKYNSIPSKDYVHISAIFGSKMMWVTVDDVCCYASDKMPYLDLLQNDAVPDKYKNGVDISICGGTDTKLTIKSFEVIEFEDDEPKIPDELTSLPELSEFDLFVQGLPSGVHDEMYRMDSYMLNDMKSSLKFKRSIDKHGHLEYKSSCGFIFQIREFGVGNYITTTWVNSTKKMDLFGSIYAKLAEKSPEYAEAVFSRTQICDPQHDGARDCDRRVTIEFNGKSRRVCAGKSHFDMSPSGFEDVRNMVAALNEVVK